MFDRSAHWLRLAENVLPAGVNSPVRAYRAVGGTPPFIASAAGARIVDVDGNDYLDYVSSWGPAILGHAHQEVVRAVADAAAQGLSFGAPTPQEVTFAQRLSERFPNLELLRCVSSGTEATMSALRVARAATNRDVIVKFEGAYHGHADALLVKAGSGAATFGTPDSAGVTEAVARTTWTLPYNRSQAVRDLLSGHGSEVAAIIVEPIAGNMGCVPPQPGFLDSIVEGCRSCGAVSIFDEVMTGCRVAAGGASERFGVVPDMTCLGKVVGGGMPLAVYGGRRELMSQVAPLGRVYQAGTLSGNPVAVAAGLATIARLDDDLYSRLETLGAQLQAGIERAIKRREVTATVQRVGSMLTVFFTSGPVVDFAAADRCDRDRFARWHRGLLTRGVYWPPSQLEAAFISAAHTSEDVERTIAAVDAALGD